MSPVVKIFYVPFSIETGGAVTPESISARHEIVLAEIDKVKLLELVGSSRKVMDFRFSYGRVRLKIVSGNQIWIADAEGNCISNEFVMSQLSGAEIDRILEKYWSRD